MKMPRIDQELTACVQCGYCISVCEAHSQTPWESDTPRGKIYYLNQLSQSDKLMDSLLKRDVTLSPYFVDAMYRCTGCGNCEVVCHANIRLVDLWEKVRTWLVQEGVGPMKAHKAMAQKVVEVHNPYNEPPSKRGDWWPAEVPKAEVPDVIFFAGCTGAYRQQTVPQNGVRILNRANVSISTMGKDEWCCSSPLLRTGTTSQSLSCAQQNVEKADGMGAKDMVMTCAGCYKTVSTDFGKYYAKVGQNVYHFAQYVEKLINEKKLPLNNEYKAKVTYHDPCHLGRHMGVFDTPRNVRKKIKGIELIEMDRSREDSRCCGAGGGYKSQYGDFAINIAAERIRDAEETGAEILVTCCPFCVTNLTQGAKAIGSKIKVLDLSDILLKVTAPKEEAPKPAGDGPKAAPAEDKAKPAPAAAPVTEPKDAARLSSAEPKPAVPSAEPKPAIAQAEPKPAITPAEPKPAITPAEPKQAIPKAEPKPAISPAPETLKVEESHTVAVSAPKAEKVEHAADEISGKQSILIVTEDVDEESEDDSGQEDAFTDNSPEARLRRAAWNKGLRCRKDYGEYNIPVAFVKPKVAVFFSKDKDVKNALENDGWAVLTFKLEDITDGEKQASDINAAVKDQRKKLKKKK